MSNDRNTLLTAEEIAFMRQQVDALPQGSPVRPEWDVYRIVATLESLIRERDEARAERDKLSAAIDAAMQSGEGQGCHIHRGTDEFRDWYRTLERALDALDGAQGASTAPRRERQGDAVTTDNTTTQIDPTAADLPGLLAGLTDERIEAMVATEPRAAEVLTARVMGYHAARVVGAGWYLRDRSGWQAYPKDPTSYGEGSEESVWRLGAPAPLTDPAAAWALLEWTGENRERAQLLAEKHYSGSGGCFGHSWLCRVDDGGAGYAVESTADAKTALVTAVLKAAAREAKAQENPCE